MLTYSEIFQVYSCLFFKFYYFYLDELLFLFHLRSPLSALRSTLTYKCRPTSRVGQPSGTYRVGDRRGDDTAQHTDMVIVEDTQGSPNDAAGLQAMELESPEHGPHPSVGMEDVRMETLDLGGDDDEVELIQQTQASQAAHAPEAMEAEASALMDVTNARSSIAAEGVARSSAAAPPPDDEVTHL
jgi:hypothetical protein